MQSNELKKQIEYYLGDANLEGDDFFRGKIEADKDGYLEIKTLLNCNKLKKAGVKEVGLIAEAVTDSTEVEVSECKLKVRRTGNKALPERKGRTLRKRESKANAKDEKKANGTAELDESPAPLVIRDE